MDGFDFLGQGLLELGLNSQSNCSLLEKMETYIDELMLFNSAYDLVGAQNRDEIIVRHILDSLSASHIIQELAQGVLNVTGQSARIADIGSGGGLPGIPLAVAIPNAQFTLVERMSKRCAFLENCIAVLGLNNVTVENKQAEQMPREQFDIEVFRAFRPLEKKMTKTLLALLKPDGIIAAYKAKKESIQEEMNAISDLVDEYKTMPLTVPFLQDRQRHLVLIKKQ